MTRTTVLLLGLLVSAIGSIALVAATISTAITPFDRWLQFDSPGEKLLAYYSYFTVWSTIMCILFGLVVRFTSLLSRVIRINAVTMITVTGLIYNFVLDNDPLVGVSVWTSPAMHTVLPIVVPVVWLATVGFRGAPDVTGRSIALSLVVPVLWTIWMFYRGEATGGYYPYSIVDVSELGYSGAVLNVLGTYALFFLLAGVMAALERLVLRGFRRRTTTVHPDMSMT